jgi:4-O-beta-D-mannosyl-D-glucose phosphorylase
MHVAVSSVEKLVDYVIHSPEDTFTSAGSVNTIIEQIEKNKEIL